MPDDVRARFEYIIATLNRQCAGSDLTREMLIRSRERLAISDLLLKSEVPNVCHAEPPGSEAPDEFQVKRTRQSRLVASASRNV